MVNIRERDSGPKVVLAQLALSTRPPQARLNIDGIFGPLVAAAVRGLQASIPVTVNGVIAGPEWRAMMTSMPFGTFDHTDVYDMFEAFSQGGLPAFQQSLAQHHQFGVIAAGDLQRAQAPIGSVGGGTSNGLGMLSNRVLSATRTTKLGLLRIFGHGNRGVQIISAGHGVPGGGSDLHGAALTSRSIRNMHHELAQIAGAFHAYGSAELHGCRVGEGQDGRRLLRDLADVWGVPVTAGIRSQSVGGGTSFRFEGPTTTAYPNGSNLRSWADRVAASNAFSLQQP